MSLLLNLAALTESELLSLFGPQELQQRLPDISRARLEGRAAPGPALAEWPSEELDLPAEGRAWGGTPEQSRALGVLDTELLTLGAQPAGVYRLSAGDTLARAYTLGDTALAVFWEEEQGTARLIPPRLNLLTWLRDRASGLACVLTTDAQQLPVPAPSEEIDLHQHPETPPVELLRLHQQYVQRLGRTQKLPGGAWLGTWQAARELNLAAWRRRGAVIEE